jgi:hypothetical protein
MRIDDIDRFVSEDHLAQYRVLASDKVPAQRKISLVAKLAKEEAAFRATCASQDEQNRPQSPEFFDDVITPARGLTSDN